MYEETKPTNTGAEEQPADAPKQLLVDMGSTVVRNSRGTIHCLTIIGQIEATGAAPQGTKTTKYEHVLPLLAGLEQSEDVDGVLLLLNTVGGDIEAGLAIAELIAGMTKPDRHACARRRAFHRYPARRERPRDDDCAVGIHDDPPVRMTGMMIAAPQTYQYFTRLQESIVRFVARSSRISEEKFRELMLHGNDMASDVGTVVYGEEAVQLGLIDRVGQLKDAYEALYAML